MTFLNLLVSLVSSLHPFWVSYGNYILALAFLCCVPSIIMLIFRR